MPGLAHDLPVAASRPRSLEHIDLGSVLERLGSTLPSELVPDGARVLPQCREHNVALVVTALGWLAAGNIVGIMPEGGVDETLRPLTMAGVQPGLHEGPNSRANPVLITPRPGAAATNADARGTDALPRSCDGSTGRAPSSPSPARGRAGGASQNHR